MKKKRFDAETIGLAVMAGAAAAESFSSSMPSHFTIKSFALQDGGEYGGTVEQKLCDLRTGYVPAVIWSSAVGAGASLLSRSWLPAIFTAGTIAFMLWSYEHALPKEKRMTLFQLTNGGLQ